MMIKTIRDLLSQMVDNIDAGNSNISEEEGMQIIQMLSSIQSPYVSKYKACELLHVSRATFDNMVREGRLPKGIKQQGFKELFWRKTDILDYLSRQSE